VYVLVFTVFSLFLSEFPEGQVGSNRNMPAGTVVGNSNLASRSPLVGFPISQAERVNRSTLSRLARSFLTRSGRAISVSPAGNMRV
jgi:hypothetical protein